MQDRLDPRQVDFSVFGEGMVSLYEQGGCRQAEQQEKRSPFIGKNLVHSIFVIAHSSRDTPKFSPARVPVLSTIKKNPFAHRQILLV